MRYVEQNPVRAKVHRKAWRYPWSSATIHVGETPDDGLLELTLWGELLEDEARWVTILEKGAYE